ncbi:Protein of unknown function DUF1376 [uncultured Caudovirales phage]|uniref:DUF1376 domain-containing protein n=1 Tax=uncultured Caudovirales phage TaxID=2100421 RepID=A0A6J7WJH9_9CAUD|nr:Protein of unknown function DUF1376 [uncultured Caudovirales phage]
MHYYQHHIGDFIKDTSFLTNEEVGIYLKLLWLYYDTEKPLPDSLDVLSMKVSCRDNKSDLLEILETFFVLIEGHWHHVRCDKEIAEYQAFCLKQKANGLKGGRPKVTQQEPKDNPMGFQAEPKITLTTNHKPLTINHINTPDGVTQSVWDDYLKIRKAAKKPITDTALKGLVREAGKAGKTLNEALVICCERSWLGFKAEWLKSDVQQVEKVRFL